MSDLKPVEEYKMLKKARKRVKKKKDFYTHLLVSIPIIPFLAIIAFVATPEEWWWFLIPSAGMMLSVAIHYLTVFGLPGMRVMDEEWKAFQLKKELEQLKTQREYEKYLAARTSGSTKQLELKELEKRYNIEDDLV